MKCGWYKAAALAGCGISLLWSGFGRAESAPPPTVDVKMEDVVRKPPRVLQNRYFLKQFRPEVSLFGGTVLNESYSQTWVGGARAGLFLTEEVGIDALYALYSASDSADLEVLKDMRFSPYDPRNQLPEDARKSLVHPEPSFTRLKSEIALLATYAPIYGKINFADFSIIYSDIYLSLGAGALKTEDSLGTGKSQIALVAAFGQRFFIGKRFSIRLEALDNIFAEERRHLDSTKKSTRHAWQATAGLCLFLF